MRGTRRLALATCGLALSVVASTVSAETITASYTVGKIELQVIRQDDPVAGLASYRLRTITEDGVLAAFRVVQPLVNGLVHQCHLGNAQTVLLEDIQPGWTSSGWTPVHTAADTHLILADASADLICMGSDFIVEGNDAGNPYGLATNGDVLKIGMGQLSGGSDIAYGRVGSSLPLQMDLMQVVIPDDAIVHFSGRVIGGYQGSIETFDSYFIDIPVGVPEPGVVALIVSAALGLLAVRRRK